jgi:hypothetical protein
MHVPIELKKITHLTTEVAFSTGFIASALVSGGCVASGRDEEPLEGGDVDAGEDAIVDVVHMDDAEAKSHAYHAPPVADAPVVMPLALEDAPTTPPPATAMAPARAAAKKQAAGKGRIVVPGTTAAQADDVYQEPTTDVVSRASKRTTVEADDDRGERRVSRKAKAKKKSDPIDQSFVPSYGRSMIGPMGGRPY